MNTRVLTFVLLSLCSSANLVLSKNVENVLRAAVENKHVSARCAKSLKVFLKSLNTTYAEKWAHKMLQSTSKVPQTVESYNFGDIGHFEECIKLKSVENDIKGKYCLVNLIFKGANSTKKILPKGVVLRMAGGLNMVRFPTWAICLPDYCSDDDAKNLTNSFLTPEVAIGSISCQTEEEVNPPLDGSAIFGISVLTGIICIVMLSTAYDIYCQNNKKAIDNPSYIAFSLHTNWKTLFNHRSSTLSCLDGIKVLSMMWIMIFHTYVLHAVAAVFNTSEIFKITNTVIGLIYYNGHLACDAFLLAGGTLVTYVYFKREKQEEITARTILKHYIHRYVRLAPAVAGLVLVTGTLIKYIGSGPKWQYMERTFQEPCRKYWWSTLLFIQNEIHTDNMCVDHTWYLAIDMQLYILSPLIFYLLKKHSKQGLAFLATATLASILVAFANGYSDDMSTVISNYYSKKPSNLIMYGYYVRTEGRASPWFMGTILGYLLTRKDNVEKRMSKFFVIPLWIVSVLVMLCCTLGGHTSLRSEEYSRLENAFFNSLVRPSFALGVSWVIWACATNNGGVINTILSSSIFQFLNKFIYSIYLLHLTCVDMIAYSHKTAIQFNIFNVSFWFWGLFAFMFALSTVWILVFESPAVNLEKIIMSKFSPPTSEKKIKETDEKPMVEGNGIPMLVALQICSEK